LVQVALTLLITFNNLLAQIVMSAHFLVAVLQVVVVVFHLGAVAHKAQSFHSNLELQVEMLAEETVVEVADKTKQVKDEMVATVKTGRRGVEKLQAQLITVVVEADKTVVGLTALVVSAVVVVAPLLEQQTQAEAEAEETVAMPLRVALDLCS
jgi:hypothetical protein